MLSRILRHRRGATLLEMVMALVIMSWVVVAAFSLFSFGITVFADSAGQFELQNNARVAVDVIREAVRYAVWAEIVPAPAAAPNDGYGYLVFRRSGDDSVLECVSAEDGEVTRFQLGHVNNITFRRLTGKTLQVTLSARDGDQTYDLRSRVLLLNIEPDEFGQDGGPQRAIRYLRAPGTGS